MKQAKIETQKPGRGNQRFRGEWVFAAIVIGIVSFPASIYFSGFLFKIGLNLPIGIIYLLIVIALSVCYIYLRKMTAVFLLKVSVIAVAVSVIIVSAMLVPYLLPRLSSEPTLWLTKLDYEPGNYVEITSEELEDLPTLQGLSNKCGYRGITELTTTRREKNRIVGLIQQKKIEHTFEMWVSTTTWQPAEILVQNTSDYTEITVEDLEQFPSINKAVSRPEMWYGISLDEWDSFLEFTQRYHNQNGVLVKYKDQFYQVNNTENISSDINNDESYIKIDGEYYIFRVGLVG